MKPRLLVVELHHLGDAVMSLPFIRGAQGKFDVHVLCRPATAAIYRLLATPPQIHEWDPPWADEGACGVLETVRAAQTEGRKLAHLGFDMAICVWADARAEILMAETGAKQRIGFPMTRRNYYASDLPWRTKNLRAGRLLENLWALTHPGKSLLTTSLHRESAAQSHMRSWEQIAEATGISSNYSLPWMKASSSTAVEALRVPGKKLLAVHASARLPSKQWPQDRWNALLKSEKLRSNFTVFQILPKADKSSLEGAASIITPDASSLASALAASDAVLCHDSLPGHLAAALGKPVVTIFGSGEPDWFAPWNNRERAIQRRVCPLHPCIDRCGMDSYLCLNAISVEDVLQQVAKLADTR